MLSGLEPHELATDGMRLEYESKVEVRHPLKGVIDLLIEPDPEKRIGSAGDALSMLEAKKAARKKRKQPSAEAMARQKREAEREKKMRVIKIASWAAGILAIASLIGIPTVGGVVRAARVKRAAPLIEAVKNKEHDTVRYLVNNGANVNGADANNNSALYHAIQLSDAATALFLLVEGADPNRRARSRYTRDYPLMAASSNGMAAVALEMAKVLHAAGGKGDFSPDDFVDYAVAGNTPLIAAAASRSGARE